MTKEIEQQELRFGIIAELAHRADKRGLSLGKVALQKHVYLLQTLFDVDCGYDFTLYTYGPFSSRLLNDLDTVEFLDGVEVHYLGGLNGYRIEPGDNNELIRKNASKFIAKASKAIDKVLDEFGNYSAKDLELYATIVYAEREAREDDVKVPEKKLVEVVQGIKPHFSDTVILGAVRKLESSDYIETI